MKSFRFSVPVLLLLLGGPVPSRLLPTKHTVVFPQLLEGRGINDERVLKISSDITLSLKQVDLLPNQLFLSEYDGTAFRTDYLDGNDYQSSIYYDDKYMAVLMMDDSDGVRVEGLLGDWRRIRPMFGSERSAGGHIAHLLYEIPLTERKAGSKVGEKEQHNDDEDPTTSPEGRVAPSIKYPAPSETVTESFVAELVVCTDPKYKEIFNYNPDKPKQLIDYISVLVASVNLKFAKTGLRLRLIGIVTKMKPFTAVQPLKSPDKVIGPDTLSNIARAMKSHEGIANADMVYVLTGSNMVNPKGTEEYDELGYALKTAGVCTEEMYAMGEDKPRLYTGVLTMTHELLHLAGSVHDGRRPYWGMKGHPGSENCTDHVYIMASSGGVVRPNNTHTKVSACTIQQVQFVMRHPNRTCLRNLDSSAELNTSNKLPGDSLNFTKYCVQILGEDYHHPDSHAPNCYIKCLNKKYNETASPLGLQLGRYRVIQAPDGVSCHQKTRAMACINGECVDKTKAGFGKKKGDKGSSKPIKKSKPV